MKFEEQVKEVAKAAKRLFVVHKEYTHFDYTCGENGDGEFYERWNIYTPTIKHNEFKTADEIIVFIKKMVEDKDGLFKNFRRLELEKERAKYKERIEEIEETLNELTESEGQ